MRHKGKKTINYILLPLIFIIIGCGIFAAAGMPLKDMLIAKVQMAVVLGSPDYSYSASNNDVKIEGYIKRSEMILPSVGSQYGNLSCEKIGLKAPVYYGDTDKVLDKGVGQYVQSGIPGEGTSILVGGHDVSYFAPLEKIKKGNILKFFTSYGEFQYKVSDINIAEATDETAYHLGSSKEQLVLYTCYPFGDVFGTRDKRLYVYCEKISGPRIQEDSNE